MNAADINPWLTLILSLIAIGGFIWSHVTSNGSKAIKDLAKLREEEKLRSDAIVARFQLIEGRVQTIEGEMKHLPDHKTAHALELAVEKLNGRIETLDERLKPVAAISERMQEILLEQAKR
jgi:hypothetical protein